MWKIENIKGQQFGNLFVLEYAGLSKNKRSQWLCKCVCGNNKIVITNSLKTGNTKSCGCIKDELDKNRFKTHGETKSKFYRIWQSMKDRCDNKRHMYFYCYGGRGITYDPSWCEFLKFKRDMVIKYKFAKRKYGDKIPLSLERRNVNDNYYFENCEFIPKVLQAKNTRRNINFEAVSPIGEKYRGNNQTDFSKQFSLCRVSIGRCIHGKRKDYKGWTFKQLKRS